MIQNKIIAFKTDEKMQHNIQNYALKTRRTTSGVIKFALDKLLEEEAEKSSHNQNMGPVSDGTA